MKIQTMFKFHIEVNDTAYDFTVTAPDEEAARSQLKQDLVNIISQLQVL